MLYSPYIQSQYPKGEKHMLFSNIIPGNFSNIIPGKLYRMVINKDYNLEEISLIRPRLPTFNYIPFKAGTSIPVYITEVDVDKIWFECLYAGKCYLVFDSNPISIYSI